MKSLCVSLALLGSLAPWITGCGRATPKKNDQLDRTFNDLMQLVLKGEIEKAAPLYRKAADDAKAKMLPAYQVKFLSDLGNCQLALYQFHASLKTMEDAREIAKSIHDDRNIAKLDSKYVYPFSGNEQPGRSCKGGRGR